MFTGHSGNVGLVKAKHLEVAGIEVKMEQSLLYNILTFSPCLKGNTVRFHNNEELANDIYPALASLTQDVAMWMI